MKSRYIVNCKDISTIEIKKNKSWKITVIINISDWWEILINPMKKWRVKLEWKKRAYRLWLIAWEVSKLEKEILKD